MLQFGGGDRPLSIKTLIRAFVDPRGADNDASVELESGNQIAAIHSKINFDGKVPFSFALELAGEDTSNNKDYQLGNTALTFGVFFPYFFSEKLTLNYEYSDWQNAWYNNDVYTKGYSNEDVVLGHWAMQAQINNLGAYEGTGHYINMQWQTPWDHVFAATLRTSKHYDESAQWAGGEVDVFDDAQLINLEYSAPIGSHYLTIGAFFGQDNFGEDFSLVKLKATW